MLDDAAVADLQMEGAEARAVAVGLDQEGAGLRVDEWRLEPPVGVRRDVDVDAGDRAAEGEILVERPLHFGVVLGVGLHRAGQTLVGEHHDEVDGRPQRLDAGCGLRDGVGELQRLDLRRHDGVLRRPAAHHADDSEAHAVALEEGVGPAEAGARAQMAHVAAQDREGNPGDLALEDLPAVVELVIADAHRVVAHHGHHLHQRFALGEDRQGAGEHVARVEQERGPGRGALAVDQGGEMRRAAEPRRAREPVGRYRVEGAVKVVGVEQGELVLAAAEPADVVPEGGEGAAERGRRERREPGEGAAGDGRHGEREDSDCRAGFVAPEPEGGETPQGAAP